MSLKFLRCPQIVKDEVQTILHLPLIERVLHPKSRRPIIALSIGISAMLAGSFLAQSAKPLNEACGAPHILVDTVGYFVHAVGAIPALRYFEPVWTILAGSVE